MASMSDAGSFIEAAAAADEAKKLILCFDDTGNTFSGTNGDTNVVKILRKLDRNHPNQFHYYQTGIGTYDVNETSINKRTTLGKFRSSVSKAIDQGFGTTFDAHIIAGYRFLMRYYENDAKIYVFGFSRGAFTAKYLARMINKVGLLCKGNEEMVPFAYRLYERSLQCESADRVAAQKEEQNVFQNGSPHDEDPSETDRLMPNGTEGSEEQHVHDENMLARASKVKESVETIAANKEIAAFGQTFCRTSGTSSEGHRNIQVFFLGIWDCVNSVAVVEKNAPAPISVTGTAKHIRHAVAVDERRVKFKPALLAQDIRNNCHDDEEDIREVWFPGNHGDIGGGWPALPQKKPSDMRWTERLSYIWSTWKPKTPDIVLDDNALQMSDMALEWMIREVDRVGKKDPRAAVHWCSGFDQFKANMNQVDQNGVSVVKTDVIKGFMHDCLSFGYGTALFKVLMWKFLEILPFVPRWELNDAIKDADKGWEPYRLWPNWSAYRDIPRGAVLHNSLIERLEDVEIYFPKNNHGSQEPGNCGQGEPCLRTANGKRAAMKPFVNPRDEKHPALDEKWDKRHVTWKFGN
ncbi:hypothetical protein QQX98_010907 [Neonectria punicea]|uniref:T6SS Phospholipase effector Tle1-like catalytic domain-containing protein n=1 Tax=Neonectria punicea TaxID=979145 RepID=A0ABR1GN42_9HYPO